MIDPTTIDEIAERLAEKLPRVSAIAVRHNPDQPLPYGVVDRRDGAGPVVVGHHLYATDAFAHRRVLDTRVMVEAVLSELAEAGVSVTEGAPVSVTQQGSVTGSVTPPEDDHQRPVSCATCRFSVERVGFGKVITGDGWIKNEEFLECHRQSAAIGWPKVEPTDWCGEHESKPTMQDADEIKRQAERLRRIEAVKRRPQTLAEFQERWGGMDP